MIEVGRYSNVPRNQRFCNKCNSGSIGDEIHFLINCDKFLNDRKTFFELVENNVQNFSNLNDEQKFIYLLTSENIPVLNAIGKYILKNICN